MSYDKQECMSALEESDEVFYARMKKGLDDVHNGRVTPLDDVYAKLSEAISEIKNGSQGADAEKSIIGKASPLCRLLCQAYAMPAFSCDKFVAQRGKQGIQSF